MTNYAYLGTACDHCGRVFYAKSTGRPRRYCGNACKQRAYRRAKEDERGRKTTEDARQWLEATAFRNVINRPEAVISPAALRNSQQGGDDANS